ncbi:MAG: retron St85 family RNA-directed DNA polymerase [Armatimonadota bacterium]
MKKGIIDQVSLYMGYKPEETLKLAKFAPTTYKEYKIPKKTSGERVIHQPSRETKALQYAIMDILFSQFPVHSSALAYEKNNGSPIRKNALLHSSYKYTIRIDFKDFFPSLKPLDLYAIPSFSSLSLSDIEFEFLSNVLFVGKNFNKYGLAIGAPSSPMISNRIMYAIDECLTQYAIDNKAVYTRYADDIIYSSDKKKDSHKFLIHVIELIKTINKPQLTINENKTRFMSKGTRRVITGLFVTPDGLISIGRENKRYIRKLLFEYKTNTISEKKLKYLQGYLAFIIDVEPLFYNQLAVKYGSTIVWNALKSRS